MKKNKIILTLYVGIIALSTIGLGASLAWYINSNQLFVNAIDITIAGDSDLKISETGEDDTFVEYIDHSESKLETVFEPVTNAYSSEWIAQKRETPIFYDDTMNWQELNDGSIKNVKESGYYTKTLYLYSDNDVYATIDPTDTYLKANASFNNAYAVELYNEYHDSPLEEGSEYAGLSVEEIKERLDKLVLAMRYSILIPDQDNYKYIILDPNKTKEENKVVEYAGLLDVDIDRKYDSFVKENVSYEKVYGDVLNRDKIVYKDEVLPADSGLEDTTKDANAFNAAHSANTKLFDKEASIANGVVFNTEKSYGLYDFAPSNNLKPLEIPLVAFEPKAIVLTIFIEGWDLESVNYTMGATFDAKMSFKVDRPRIA